MATIEGQVGVGVAGEEDRAEVEFEGDGLHPTVHADIPLRCKTRIHTKTQVQNEWSVDEMYHFFAICT